MQKTEKILFNWEIHIKDSIKLMLENQIIRNNLAPSYLFYGPGPKYKVARELAKIILCQSRNRPCKGDCCRRVAEGTNPDFIIIKKEKKDTQIKIEKIREVRKSVSMKSRKRVVLIKNAEYLNINAANALLKTLEEPSKETTFILTTRNIKELIPTIISRCQGIYLALESYTNIYHDREKRVTDFLYGDLIRRFQFAREIAENRGDTVNFINQLELVLRSEMIDKGNLKKKKDIMAEIKNLTGHRLLLKRNVSARLILEDLAIRLKKRV